MAGRSELSLRWGGKSARWVTAVSVLFAVAAGVAAARGVPDAKDWGVMSGVVGVGAVGCALGVLRRRVEAGPDGLRIRAVLRWRQLTWEEIVRLEGLRIAADPRARSGERLRAAATLRDGSVVWLPVPFVGAADMAGFENEMAQLRAVQRRYAPRTPRS